LISHGDNTSQDNDRGSIGKVRDDCKKENSISRGTLSDYRGSVGMKQTQQQQNVPDGDTLLPIFLQRIEGSKREVSTISLKNIKLCLVDLRSPISTKLGMVIEEVRAVAASQSILT